MTKNEKLLAIGITPANGIIAGAGVLWVLILAYFVYYYGWTEQRQFTSWRAMLLCYVSPALLAILLFASLRLRQSRRINLALAIFSIGVSSFALETLLTVWLNLPSVTQDLALKRRVEAAKALGIEFDSRTKTQVVDELRGRGIDAVPSVFPKALLKEQNDGTMKSLITINGVEVLPLAGMANKVAVLCNDGGQFVTYRSDTHGFHNPQTLWDIASIDIVAVGDSYVHGWCVPPDDNFVAIIRKRHPATLNLGIEGNGPLTMLATIKEYAEIVKPKVVLWFYFEGNDIKDLSMERNSPLLRRYLTSEFSQGLLAHQTEIDHALDEHIKTARDENRSLARLKEIIAYLDKLPSKIKNIIVLRQLRHQFGLVQKTAADRPRSAASSPAAKRYNLEIELLGDILARAKESVSRWGGVLYFVYLPSYLRYAPEQTNFWRDQVLRAANKVGLPVIDIHRTFTVQKDPLVLFPLRIQSHYNQEGHRLVAEEVLRSISVGQ
jgi:hypothetical protein